MLMSEFYKASKRIVLNWLPYLLALLLIFNSLFSDKVKMAIWGLLVMTVFRFVQEIDQRLSRKHSGEIFNDFDELRPKLEAAVRQELNNHQTIKLDITAVAGRYSAPFICDRLMKILEERYTESNVVINFARVKKETLEDWSPGGHWTADLRHWSSVLEMTRNHPRVTFNEFEYDSIPQRHGILVNERVLFVSWTDWKFSPAPELRVGECRYVQYKKSDAEGDLRIANFQSFMERIKRRHNELQSAHAQK